MTTFDYNYSTSQEHLQKDAVVIMQRVDDLVIKHYGVCDSNSPENVKMSKGLIYSTVQETGEETLVCKNIGFTPEVSSDADLIEVANTVHDVFLDPEAKIFDSHESSSLRIWYHHSAQKWYMSTNRKIDAFNSKWAKPESYGAIFTRLLQQRNPEMTLDTYYAGLNTDYIYLFSLLATIENRIVTTKTEDQCYFIGAFNTKDNFNFTFDHAGVVFDHPREVTGITTVEQLCKYVSDVNPRDQQGIMIVKSGYNVQSIKIVHPMYMRAFNIRNNTLTPLNRFIQLMSKKYSTDDATVINSINANVRELQDVYPELRQQFDDFKDVIASVAKNVREAFKKRISGQRNVFVPKQQNQVLKELFNTYTACQTKETFDMTLNDMFKIVYRLNENSLYHLYSSFNERRRVMGNGNLLSRDEIRDLKTRIK